MLGFFKERFKIAVLVSGRGSNLEAVIRSIEGGKLKGVKICLVLSDNPGAKALEVAAKHGIKTRYINPGPFKTKLEGDAENDYIQAIQDSGADLVVLAGFMRVLKPRFIRAFANRIINIHPSLLPKYPGLHTHQRALEAGEKETGCTVHYVSEVVDGGKRIMQAKIPVEPGDTEENLAKRVLEKEHIMLSWVIGLIASGKIKYENLSDKPILME